MSTADMLLLAVHASATAAMVGLIWFVQIVHYPLFAAVGENSFVDYEALHTVRTGWVVGPLMGVESLSAVVIAVGLTDEVGVALAVVGLVLLVGIHASTILLQVPAHRRLSTGFDASVHRRLVRTNWIRTVGWSLRGLVAVAMLVVAV